MVKSTMKQKPFISRILATASSSLFLFNGLMSPLLAQVPAGNDATEALAFHAAQLESGRDGADNAVYRFPLIAPGKDALITITGRSSADVQVENIDLNNQGYDLAFQPLISYKNGSVTEAADWWVEYRLDFVNHNSSDSAILPSFYFSALDMDGDNGKLNEQVMLQGASAFYSLSNASISIRNETEMQGNEMVQVSDLQASRMNFPGIDTAKRAIMTSFFFRNKDHIVFRLGAATRGPSTATRRLYSIYFKNFVYNSPNFMVPLMIKGFDARENKQVINLEWTTAWEKNLDHFEVETSTDGKHFESMYYIGSSGNSSTDIRYHFIDSRKDQTGLLYYRLKVVSTDADYGYSSTRLVRLSADETSAANLQVYPNPVQNIGRVILPSSWQGKTVTFYLYSQNGSLQQSWQIDKASQAEQVDLTAFNPGTYFVKLMQSDDSRLTRLVKE